MVRQSSAVRDAKTLDATLRALFRGLQARAVPAALRSIADQLEAQEKRAA